MTRTNGGPAFPVDTLTQYQSGMTLRDYFAAQALQGLWPRTDDGPEMAKRAYALADAMLAEREK